MNSLPPPLPQPKRLEDDIGMRMLLPVGQSGWAIAAGYAGLFALLLAPAPIAVILALIAIWDIRKSKQAGKRKYGMGRAVFGLVAGILGTGVLVTLLIIFFLSATSA